jgi:signal transduction histidine kinase
MPVIAQSHPSSWRERYGFLGLSLIVLAIGIFGITRSWVRPGLPFTWGIREQQITVKKILAPDADLSLNDVLLGSDGIPLRHHEELEFLFDGKTRNDSVAIMVSRQGQTSTVSIKPRENWYSRPYLIINFIIGLCLWGIGTWVVLYRPEDKPARLFFLLTLSLTILVMVGTARLPAGTSSWNYFLPAFYYLVYPFFPALLLHFLLSFPRHKRLLHSPQQQALAIYVPAAVFVVALEIYHGRALFSADMALFREYYRVFNLHRSYIVIYFLLSMAALAHSYFTANDESEKSKTRWILWGIAVGASPFILLWTLPNLLDNAPLIPEEVANLAIIVAPLSFAVAIVKYRLFDVEIVINRSIVYSLLTGAIIAFYLLLVGFAGNFLHDGISPNANSFIAIICTLLAAVIFQPAKQIIQRFVDRTFYRVKYHYRLAINAFSPLMVTARSRQETLELLMAHIENSIPLEKMAVLLPHNGVFEIAASRGVKDEEKSWLGFSEDDEVIKLAKAQAKPLAKAGCADSSAVVDLPVWKKFERTGMEILLPVERSTGQWGGLLLGQKRSGTRYSAKDLELLSMLALEAFSALERIHLQEMTIYERAEKEKLEALSQLKSEFISLVSHELRTPLTAIRWSAKNLLDGIPAKSPPKVEDYLKGIHASSLHLGRMIENLLDVSKIESGKLEILPESVCLAEMIGTVIHSVTPLVAGKNLRMQTEVSKDLQVKADRDALQEILSNLIENAIKYSPEGKTVSIEAHGAQGRVIISVRDEGVGIPAEKQKNIFEKFERVYQDKKTREKGLGLGLYIVKKLVEAQSGTIQVQSQIGVGSTFTITLPRV